MRTVIGERGQHLVDLTFDGFLAPYEEAFFLQEALGQSALYVIGGPDKFRGLFSWDALNHLMRFGALGFPRLRLIDGNVELPAHTYLRTGMSGYPRPLMYEINSALRDGAALAIESLEEVHEPVSQLCEVLEERLEVPVTVDLYASWRDKTAPVLRWNEHDVIVLQLEGCKSWLVHGATATHPVAECFPPQPTAEEAWTGVLGPGNLLYIPRGWWYRETTMEPALYLGVKFRRPTGVEVLQRLFDQLTRSTEIRADCPRLDRPECQSAFIKTIHKQVNEACTSPGLLLGFLRDLKTFAEPRIGFSFPWGASDLALPASGTCLLRSLVRFPGPDSLRHSVNEDSIEIPLCGKVIRFDEDTGKILTRICYTEQLTVLGLMAAFASEMSQEKVLTALSNLVQHGLVELRAPGFFERRDSIGSVIRDHSREEVSTENAARLASSTTLSRPG